MVSRKLNVTFPKKKMFILFFLVSVFFVSWNFIRFWLMTLPSMSGQIILLMDMALVFVIGLVIITIISRLIARHVTVYVGATQGNAIRLLFQLASFSIILLIVSSMIGINIVSAAVGVGFLGIVLGLAAQSVLGNIFSGLMLVASRPFNIGDRVALITWQYGKFPPSLSHGWIEPSYTGCVKEITLVYTKILTDSNILVTVPNGVVIQSLILNLSHDKYDYVGTQFEVPIHVDPDELHKSLSSQLSEISDFKGEEESFEVLGVSPSAYLVAINYRVGKQCGRDMNSLLFRAIRMVLASTYKSNAK